MSHLEQLAKHRHKLVPLLVTLALVAAGVSFRTELTTWFTGESPSSTAMSAPASSHVHAGRPVSPSQPTAASSRVHHEFDAATLERLRAAFGAYEQARALLAKDSTQGLDAQARQVAAALDAAQEEAASLPTPIQQALKQASRAAGELAKATSAADARGPFGDLSRELVTLGEADPRLSQGLHLYQCPMAKGYQNWFQPDQHIANPYMGQKMPTCGERQSWEKAPTSAKPVEDNHEGDDEIAYYTCSMHPSVKQKTPGNCPICGMKLTPVTKHEQNTGMILVDEARRQRIGVRTGTVQKRQLALQVRTVGAVRYDESRLHDVNLRMSGWVQKLLVNETGQRVAKGQTLFTLYSPELYAAQLEHLAAVKRQTEGGEMLAHLAQASRTRLRLLGMTEGQIDALDKRGQAEENVPIAAPASGYVIEKEVVDGARVEAGMRVYRIADLSKVWIDADIYESDLPHVRVGQSVSVELPYLGDKRLAGKVDYVYPTLEAQTRTGKARVVLDNKGLELKPDMYANVFIDVALGERLAVPDSAVVYTGPRRLVFVDRGGGRLEPKVVTLGVHVDGFYEVTSGLMPGDVVVTSGNFLIAAESRIRSAATYWESSDAPQ